MTKEVSHRFRRRAAEVRAFQIGPDGVVEVDHRQLIGSTSTWIVVAEDGTHTVWTDPEFRATFEPLDEEARRYLEKAVRS